MSSKNRPLRELSQAPQTLCYAPSTPHAIRALQQRSGARQRSTRINKTRTDALRPDSARGILRRLAKITAPVTKRRVSTPSVKENASTGKTEVDDVVDERPDFTLPIVEENGWDDEPESDLGEAPTPSALPGGDYDPTITFQTIPVAAETRQSMGERARRRVSRISNTSRDEDREVEIGRRAVSEGPMDRYPRSSFGSIRMSDFGLDQQGQISDNTEGDKTGFGAPDDYDIGVGFDDDEPHLEYASALTVPDILLTCGSNETEDFRRHRRSPSIPNELNLGEQDGSDDDNTFRLEMPHETEARELNSRITPSNKDINNSGQDLGSDDMDEEESASPDPDTPQNKTRPLTPMEAATARRPRRKKVKLTRHGIEIPALPSSLIKRVAIESMTRRGKRKPIIDRAILQALEQATEWFFEQVGEDLEAYSNHAGRTKRIDASDVMTLMRRQLVLKGDGKLGDFAIEQLPTEALLELDLPDTL
jgi:histone H3/H4